MFFASYFVFAESNNLGNIVYPIMELGDCQSKEDCRVFCDQLENMESCVNFAQNNNLISIGEAVKARKIAKLKKGPGKCATYDSCEQYCEDEDNIKECLLFAQKYNLMSREELEKANKIVELFEKRKTPKGCKIKKECEAYCERIENFEECFSFAKEAGLLSSDEIEKIEKALKVNSSNCDLDGFCLEKDVHSKSTGSSRNDVDGSYSELPVDSSYNSKLPEQLLENAQGDDNTDASEKISPENNIDKTPIPSVVERDLFSENNISNTDSSKDSLTNECMKEIYGSDVLEKIASGSFVVPIDMKERIDLCVVEKNAI